MKKWEGKINRLEQLLKALCGDPGHNNTQWLIDLVTMADNGDLRAVKILTDLDQQWQVLMAACPTDDLTPGERVAELARRSLQPGGGDIQQQFTRLLAIVQEGVALH